MAGEGTRAHPIPLSHFIRVFGRYLWLIVPVTLLACLVGGELASETRTVTARVTLALDVAWQDITTSRQEIQDFFDDAGESIAAARDGVSAVELVQPANEQAANVQIVATGSNEAETIEAVELGIAALIERSRERALREIEGERAAISAAITGLEAQIVERQAIISAARAEIDSLQAIESAPVSEIGRLGDLVFLTNLEVEQMTRQVAEFNRDLDRLALRADVDSSDLRRATRVSAERGGGIGQNPLQLAIAMAAFVALMVSVGVLVWHHLYGRLRSANQLRVLDRSAHVVDLSRKHGGSEDLQRGKVRVLAAELGRRGGSVLLVDLRDGSAACRLADHLIDANGVHATFNPIGPLVQGAGLGGGRYLVGPNGPVELRCAGQLQGVMADVATADAFVVVAELGRDRTRRLRRFRSLLAELNEVPQTVVIIDRTKRVAKEENTRDGDDRTTVAALRQ